MKNILINLGQTNNQFDLHYLQKYALRNEMGPIFEKK